jgi:hypothetical protein
VGSASRRIFLFVAGALLGACGGAAAVPQTQSPELDPIDRAAIDVLAREACPRVLTRTFPLEDTSRNAVTGKLWVRRCTARASHGALDIDVDVLGWQWVGQGSWGFDVREYVYFSATVRARLHASVDTEGRSPKVRVWSDGLPEVAVREIGRVSARAQGPASSLLGVASGIVGRGPNVLATASFRSRVRDLIRERATQGLVFTLGNTPAPGMSDHANSEMLSEKEALFPGGALISGSYPADLPTTIRFDVVEGGAVLARAVCVDDALALVDAVVADQPRPLTQQPTDVLTLHDHGEVRIPARPCAWVLVTGTRDDASAVVKILLEPTRDVRQPTKRRWVRATLLAYEVEGGGADLFGFTIGGVDRAPRALGHPLTSARSPSVWLVADPTELEDGRPLVIGVSAWKPRPRSFWSATQTYDQTPLGRATIAPATGAREERRAVLERAGRSVGWVEVVLEMVDVE